MEGDRGQKNRTEEIRLTLKEKEKNENSVNA